MSRVLSSTYNALEEGIEKKPTELFHFWCGSNNWYYTNLDEKVIFKLITYNPGVIKRSPVEYRTDLNVPRLQISIASVTHPIVEYIAKNPVDIVWVQVSRIFTEQEDDEAAVIFVGQIKTPSFRGQNTSIECIGFEHYLRQPIPTERYQPQCNYTVFDDRCGVDDSSYKVSGVSATVDVTKRILTATEFGAEDDGYWVYGYVNYDDYRRMIIRHESNLVTLSYPLWRAGSTITVDVWPGCDRGIRTCRDKFNNVSEFLGFPNMPFDNPALWT